MSIAVDVKLSQGDFALQAAFTAESGVTALFGQSGAGKSTLAALIAGLRRPSTGRIVLDDTVLVDTAAGVFVPRQKRRIGVVFQEARLFPQLSVRANLRFGQRFLPRGERAPELGPVVELLGIGSLLERRPRHLSGGEQQRVAIGRALLMRPQALVMDEPLASIDEARRAEILPYLDRLKSELRIPIVYISHAVAEIARLADTVVVLGAGRVTAAGTAADILSRLDLPQLGAAEQGAILTATVLSVDASRGTAVLAHPAGSLTVPAVAAPAGTALRLRIHARDVALAVGDPGRISIRNRLPARIIELGQATGGGVDVRLDAGGSPLLARITEDAVADLGLGPGSEVTALIKAIAVEGYRA